MANTYEQTRDFIMSMGFTEAEARTMITTAVDFSTTQLVDGNWGMVSARGRRAARPAPGAERTD